MGKAIRASALALILVCSANAGVIQFGVKDTPPPPPSAITTGTDSQQQDTGIVMNGSPESMSDQETSEEASLLVQIALNLFTLL